MKINKNAVNKTWSFEKTLTFDGDRFTVDDIVEIKVAHYRICKGKHEIDYDTYKGRIKDILYTEGAVSRSRIILDMSKEYKHDEIMVSVFNMEEIKKIEK